MMNRRGMVVGMMACVLSAQVPPAWSHGGSGGEELETRLRAGKNGNWSAWSVPTSTPNVDVIIIVEW